MANVPVKRENVFAVTADMAEYVQPEYDYGQWSTGAGQAIGMLKLKGKTYIREINKMQETASPDGEIASTVDVIIVGSNPKFTRAFYRWDANYNAAERKPPLCASDDGVEPRDESPELQSTKGCYACPQAQRNTASGGQRKGSACKKYKPIAVLPYWDTINEEYNGPMMFRIPPDSLRNFEELVARFQRNRAQFHMYVVRLGFDPAIDHPRITFTPLGMADPDVMPDVIKWLDDPHTNRVVRHVEVEEAPEDDPDALPGHMASSAPVPQRTTPPKAAAKVNGHATPAVQAVKPIVAQAPAVAKAPAMDARAAAVAEARRKAAAAAAEAAALEEEVAAELKTDTTNLVSLHDGVEDDTADVIPEGVDMSSEDILSALDEEAQG